MMRSPRSKWKQSSYWYQSREALTQSRLSANEIDSDHEIFYDHDKETSGGTELAYTREGGLRGGGLPPRKVAYHGQVAYHGAVNCLGALARAGFNTSCWSHLHSPKFSAPARKPCDNSRTMAGISPDGAHLSSS